MIYHVNSIYLHKMARYIDHNAEDFQPPFVVKRVVYNWARGRRISIRLHRAVIDAGAT